jgi:hypothetical protein
VIVVASSNKTLWIVLGAVGAFLLLSCCGAAVLIGLLVPAVQKVREAADRTMKLNELSMVGIGIHTYYDANNHRMPADVNDIQAFVGNPAVVAHIRSGEIEVIWNAVGLLEENRGTGNVIIAWNTVPTADGMRLVLFMDGAVAAITESDFQKRPKARVADKK